MLKINITKLQNCSLCHLLVRKKKKNGFSYKFYFHVRKGLRCSWGICKLSLTKSRTTKRIRFCLPPVSYHHNKRYSNRPKLTTKVDRRSGLHHTRRVSSPRVTTQDTGFFNSLTDSS